jgi:hypothetical protein
MWKIISTTDGDHVGTDIPSVEEGQILTFEDGDVVAITTIFLNAEGDQMIASGINYSMTLKKV